MVVAVETALEPLDRDVFGKSQMCRAQGHRDVDPCVGLPVASQIDETGPQSLVNREGLRAGVAQVVEHHVSRPTDQFHASDRVDRRFAKLDLRHRAHGTEFDLGQP